MSLHRLHPKYERITEKWGNMKTRRDLGVRIDNWLSLFPDDRKELLLQLLSSFYYYSEELVRNRVKTLYELFVSQYEGDQSKTVYSKILNKHRVAHSDIFYGQFWLINGIYSYAVNAIAGLIEESLPDALVIVDDFTGSGLSLMETIDAILEVNPAAVNIEYFFLVLHSTNKAIENINDYCKKVGIDIGIYSLVCTDNAFKGDYIFSKEEVGLKKKEYSEIYHKYELLLSYEFGFHNVASLTAFHYNSPNDTLGLFWQNIKENKALFNRDITNRNTALSQMITSAKQRQSSRDKALYGIDEGRVRKMLEYCVEFGKGFSLVSFIERFDLVPEQANTILEKFIDEGYLLANEGSLLPSEALKSKMYITRLKRMWKNDAVKKQKTTFDNHLEYIPVNFGKEK